ncbi:MAG: DegT/DnrJ/EryC1/StrS family aminotransferase [Patescibacteria group bacterium]|nr:DegT/DnrJ/EryC1/StrS family aminotransferase [Patescibacteria group bacterium]
MKSVADVVKSGWISEGPQTKEFEEKYRKFVGTKFAVATTSGTAAIFLALSGSGIQRGDEVIIPNMTFVATATAVKLLGAKPIIAEINKDNFTISISSIRKKITKKTKAIIPVHLNGRTTELDELKEICTMSGIKLIEDASQGLGSKYGKKFLGSIGDVAAFSLAPTKIITTGQGGIITTNDFEIYDKIVLIKDQGRRMKRDDYQIVGYNFKFTDIQAALGNSQFSKLKSRLNYMKKVFNHYNELLEKNTTLTIPQNRPETQIWYFDILTKNRHNNLVKYLLKNKIITREFSKPLHVHPPYKTKDKFPVSEKISSLGLYLPSHVEVTLDQAEYICKKINSFFTYH